MLALMVQGMRHFQSQRFMGAGLFKPRKLQHEVLMSFIATTVTHCDPEYLLTRHLHYPRFEDDRVQAFVPNMGICDSFLTR